MVLPASHPLEAACTYHGLQLLFQHHLERQPDRALKQLAQIIA